jgi:arylsulfatase A-like enzyme
MQKAVSFMLKIRRSNKTMGKLSRKLRYFYRKGIRRPLLVVWEALIQFYSRIAMFFLVRGIVIPGSRKLKDNQTLESRAALERQILVRKLKSERFSTGFGPFWLRRIGDSTLKTFAKYRILLNVMAKILVSVFLVVIPLGLFVVMRGMLPVPERVGTRDPATQLKKQSHLRTDWLYTEGPFESEKKSPQKAFAYLDPAKPRGPFVTFVHEPDVPLGLVHVGIGTYPRRVDLVRGFLASEKAPLVIPRQRPVRIDMSGRNRLRIRGYLFPHPSKKAGIRCRAEIRDENDRLLFGVEGKTPRYLKPDKNSISELFRQRFTPAAFPVTGEIQDFVLDTDVPPAFLKVTLKVIREGTALADPKVLDETPQAKKELHNEVKMVVEGRSVAPELKDLSDDECVYALGDLSFEREMIKPLARRGVILLVVDMLQKALADDAHSMPFLNSLVQKDMVNFSEHRSISHMTVPSVSGLMTSLYPRDIGSPAFVYSADTELKKNFYKRRLPTIASQFRNQGYRSAALGSVSLFTEALEGGIDIGFHEALVLESPQYETRHLTEEALNWLESYGNSPFFLYLHYHTAHSPYRPPLENLALGKLLFSPLSMSRSQELYKGLGRYLDSELKLFFDKLNALGIANEVDIIVTSDHGAQMAAQPYGYYSGMNSDIRAATSSKGHSLSDEEIKVPFFARIAGLPAGGQTVRAPTSHVDLLPTLSGLAGTPLANANLRGLDLSPWLKNWNLQSLEKKLMAREKIYFEGHEFAGILYFGGEFAQAPLKYWKQFSKKSLQLDFPSWPWMKREEWFEPEQLSKVNFKSGEETWIPWVNPYSLKQLRKAYLATAPGARGMKLKMFQNARLNLSMLFHSENGLGPVLETWPEGMKSDRSVDGKTWRLKLEGDVKLLDEITLALNSSVLKNIEGEDVSFVGCASAMLFQPEYLVKAFNDSDCIYQTPSDAFVEMNYREKFAVAVSKTLGADVAEEVRTLGAGSALEQALKDWGYAK